MEKNEIYLSGIILFPILGVVCLLIWRNATKKQAMAIGLISEFIAFLIPVLLLSSLRKNDKVIFSLPWITNMGISFRLSLNWLSLVFLLTEVLVTIAAMVYSLGEKTGKKNSNYYYALLILFSLGMAGTTLADDAFLFYIFWELMLIASVLLILIWGHGEIRFRVALKYFIVTHLGSLLVLVCLITLFVNVGSANISEWMAQTASLGQNLQFMLIAFFVIGFSVKMAIFPLHIWLPDAHTVAPMPVTIILAAAMLSMGAYGIIRFPFSLFPLESLQPFAVWMMIAGIMSEIYGALMSLAETDIKRIIAFSSVSQMGYILFGLGTLTLSGMEGAVLHVVYHAIVKALLFMVVGIIIKVTQEREIQNISGLGFKYPILCVCAAIGVLGISGMPPLGIFNSEWMIFAGGFDSGVSTALTIVSLLGSLLTVFYALRFFGMIFFGKRVPESILDKAPPALTLPTLVVTLFLIVEGLLPGPLLTWAKNGLTDFIGSFQ